MNAYTELFEYASQLVRNFIDNEIVLASPRQEDLFSESSWQSCFFGFNLRQLHHPDVRKQAEIMLDTKETEQRPYNAALARVTSLYISLTIGCGKDNIDKMIDNCVEAINDFDALTKKKGDDPIREMMIKYPILIISALGNNYFVSKKSDFLKASRLKTNLDRGSQK